MSHQQGMLSPVAPAANPALVFFSTRFHLPGSHQEKRSNPTHYGEKKGRGELLMLHLGQMKFFQFKGEVIRDSIKDLEAVCSFALGSHPYSNNLGRKKAWISTQQPSWLTDPHRDPSPMGCPTANSPQGHSPAARRAGDGRLEAGGIKQIKQEGERNKFPWTGSVSSQMTSSAPLASLACGRQHCSCIFHK